MKIILLSLTIFLASCTSGYTFPEMWEAAEKVCEPNGGIYYVDASVLSKKVFSVKCNNGAYFEEIGI